MIITGANFIGSKTYSSGDQTFQAFDPAKNEYLPQRFTMATEEEFQLAIQLASQAFVEYSLMPSVDRAEFLEQIASEIFELGDLLIERCSAESGLPISRITGERQRTCSQLQLFAALLRDGWWVDARIDNADAKRQPLPKPDIRRMLFPLGPVAIFGASNFPLAFSTAGGDTASALAAGCPVVVKCHSSHPGTNALVASAIVKAARRTSMPKGVFSSLHLSHSQAVKLVEDSKIKAVGFTGSREVGMTLFNAATRRPEPIPVYAEMSAANPVIIFGGALRVQKEKIAKGLAASVTMGAGQFCTKPGLVFIKESDYAISFLREFARHIDESLPATMLNKNIFNAYSTKVKFLQSAAEIEVLTDLSEGSHGHLQAQPVAYVVDALNFVSNKEFSEEIFGPATLFVKCKDEVELINAVKSLDGQLTATVHATEEDEEELKSIIDIVVQKAGRIVYDGYPTGVEVCHATQHGGPFPSTTDSRSTSVGTAAIYRFLRPIACNPTVKYILPR